VQRNLRTVRDVPGEGDAVLRRGPARQRPLERRLLLRLLRGDPPLGLNETNGFAGETVTEDAHTALKLQRRGWNSAFWKSGCRRAWPPSAWPCTSASASAGRGA
jgi:cellulose synthase (UDP-forming)